MAAGKQSVSAGLGCGLGWTPALSETHSAVEAACGAVQVLHLFRVADGYDPSLILDESPDCYDDRMMFNGAARYANVPGGR